MTDLSIADAITEYVKAHKFDATVAAVFGALASALVSTVSKLFVSHDVERLKSRLKEAAEETKARREYTHEARKRLYEDVEQLLFRLSEASELALKRVRSIARSKKCDDLEELLKGKNSSYYLTSIMYRLLLPCAIVQLIRRKLTMVDLSVDPDIATQYRIARVLYFTWTADFDLAAGGSKFEDDKESPLKLKYEPNVSNWEDVRDDNPGIHWRQGLPLGRLDTAAELLIKDIPGEPARPITYGEFVEAYDDPDSRIGAFFHRYFDDILIGFDPITRPVLWRVIIAQGVVLNTLITARPTLGIREEGEKSKLSKPDELIKLVDKIVDNMETNPRFRYSDDPSTDESQKSAFEAARNYIVATLQPEQVLPSPDSKVAPV